MLEVCGFQRSSFEAKDNGQIITGWNIFVTFEDPKVTGFRCDRLYLSDGKAAKCNYQPQVGDKIQVNYNRYGKVESVERV